MGAWGAALYADDTTCEVRDAFVDHLRQGLSAEDAGAAVLRGYGDTLANHEVACLVYFALADTAWKYGRLEAGVRARALELLSEGGDLAVWERDAPEDLNARRRALRTLEARLRSEPPSPRPIKRTQPRPKRIRTSAPIGAVFLLDLARGWKAMLVLVGQLDLGKSVDPVFTVPLWRARRAPTQQEVDAALASTMTFESGLGEQRHVGILPSDGRRNVMAHLEPTVLVARTPLPFDPDLAVFKNVEAIVGEIEARLDGTAAAR